MADVYIAPAATGTGSGADASNRTTWDLMTAFSFSTGDTIFAATGDYTCSLSLQMSAAEMRLQVDDGATFDFGSFSGICIEATMDDVTIIGFHATAASASHIIDFDVEFDCQAHQCSGDGFFDTRAGRRTQWAQIDADEIQTSGGMALNCKATTSIHNDSQSFNSAIVSSVSESFRTGEGGVAHKIIAVGGTNGVAGDRAKVTESVIIDCTTGVNATNGIVEDCLFFGNTTDTSGIAVSNNNTVMDADPFEDSANWDLRITTAAQGKSYIGRLVRIMLCQLDTPGITMNTEAELLAMVSSGSSNFDPYKSAFYRV